MMQLQHYWPSSNKRRKKQKHSPPCAVIILLPPLQPQAPWLSITPRLELMMLHQPQQNCSSSTARKQHVVPYQNALSWQRTAPQPCQLNKALSSPWALPHLGPSLVKDRALMVTPTNCAINVFLKSNLLVPLSNKRSHKCQTAPLH